MEPILNPVRVESFLAPGEGRTLAQDVRDGLTRPSKELPPKHFYDERGADLFDQICEVPEYYPTRCEREILEGRSDEIAQLTGATELVELGSGTAAKTRILLTAMHAAGNLDLYVPFDVTEGMVRDVSHELVALFPGMRAHGVIGDFERHLGHVPAPEGPRIVAFLGGTVGNFMPGPRRRLLRAISGMLGDDGHLLLGTDLVKDVATLEAAYDDSAGVTAEFNRNILHVINRELGADFDLEAFEHVARFDAEHEWIEMRLRATRAMRVRIPAIDLEVDFAQGEEIRTEISAKFTRERLERDLAAGGLEIAQQYRDERDWFALTLARRLA